ncbi:hypothetical protein TGMAS_417410, partial [Toxoplasma gondii MAS]
ILENTRAVLGALSDFTDSFPGGGSSERHLQVGGSARLRRKQFSVSRSRPRHGASCAETHRKRVPTRLLGSPAKLSLACIVAQVSRQAPR